MDKWQKLLIVASILVFVGSLFPDNVCIDGRCDSWPGWSLLLMGGIAVFASPANMTWLANLALFASWGLLLRSHWLAALITGGIALIEGASFQFYDGVLSSESGNLSSITGTAIGYWFWLASMAIATICAAYSMWQSRMSPLPHEIAAAQRVTQNRRT